MNILITSVSKKVLLVKKFKQVLSEFSDGKIICADINPESIGLKFGDKSYITVRNTFDNFIENLLEICSKENIKLIIPTSCADVKIFSENINKFGEIRVMVCNKETVEICQNKKKFIDFCIYNNFNVPKTYSRIDEQYLPLFCKPIFGKSSQNLYKLVTKLDVNKFLEINREEDFIIQEMIEDEEFTIDYFGDFNGNFIDLCIRRRLEITGGESTISEIIKNEIIFEKCKNIGEKLKLIGHNNIQVFFNEETGNLKFIEINNRFGGCSNLSLESGLNSVHYLLELIKYGKVNKKEISENKVYKYTTDLIIPKELPKGKIYCIDIDGTICTETHGKYDDCKPIQNVIDKVNLLYENGNEIILYTARGAKSGYNWYDYTKNQVDLWNVKYSKLIMGKPFADYYIDNKAINVFDWI